MSRGGTDNAVPRLGGLGRRAALAWHDGSAHVADRTDGRWGPGSGMPAGVGNRVDPPFYLAPGDRLIGRIEG